jgi:hypothetical protein
MHVQKERKRLELLARHVASVHFHSARNVGAAKAPDVPVAPLAQQVHINQHRGNQVVIFAREEPIRIRPRLHPAQIATLGQSHPTGHPCALSVLLANSILHTDALYQPEDAKAVLQEHFRREVAWGTQVAVYRARQAGLLCAGGCFHLYEMHRWESVKRIKRTRI